MTSSTELADRYGVPGAGRRRIIIALTALLATVGLAWLLWVAAFHSAPAAESELVGFTIVGEHEATAKIRVTLRDAADPSCRVRATSEDHSTVGELNFAPLAGLQTVTIRTERRATSVEMVGCVAKGQNRPR